MYVAAAHIDATAGAINGPYCVVEYSSFATGGIWPLLLITTQMAQAFTLVDAFKNSEFRRQVTPDTPLRTTVHAIGSRADCIAHAASLLAQRNPKPFCNVHGRDLTKSARPVECSNGHEYPSQAAAALGTGVDQASISRVLRAKAQTAGGWRFWYKDLGR